MAQIDIPSNSHRAHKVSDQEQKMEVTPVVSGGVSKQKRSKSSFLADDFKDVKDYVVSDVIVPAAKSTIVDIVSKGINMLIYGEDRGPSSRHTGSGARLNYSDVSRRSSRDDRDDYYRRPRRVSTRDWDNLTFRDDPQGKEDWKSGRVKAELVLSTMCDMLDDDPRRGVTIGDLYDLAEQQTLSTDFNWGWYDLRGVEVRYDGRVNGYYLTLPNPVQMDR